MLRIATTQFHSTMNAALHRSSRQMEDIMQKMSSGQSFLVASEDPVSTVRMLRLSRESAALDQYQTNIKTLQTRLNINEAHLRGMVSDLQDGRDLMVWAANGGNSPDDINAIATPLASLRDSVLAVANQRDEEGRYLFSGTATDKPTISYDPAQPVGSRYSWTGNLGKQQVGVGNGVTADANVTLEGLATVLNQIDLSVTALGAPGADPNNPALVAQVRATLDATDDALNAVSSKVGTIGGEMKVVDTLLGGHENMQLSNDQAYLALGQLDYGDATVKLQGYTTALQATQKAYGKVNSLSLFDVI